MWDLFFFFIKKNSWSNSLFKINKFGPVAGCVFSTQNSWHIIFNPNMRYKIKFFLTVKIKIWQGNQNNKNIYIKRKVKEYIA